MDSLEQDGREQMDGAAFWRVGGEYGIEYEPIDERAIYGYPVSGDRGDEDFDFPHRNALYDKVTAIRTVEPGDRVRVNDGGWMEVVDLDSGFVDEGFACVYENGSVVYAVRANDMYGPEEYNEDTMRRWNDHSAAGIVHCLEVDWSDDRPALP